MPENNTSFDVSKHHIHLEFIVTDLNGIWHSVTGILDTGAPRTEFSDQFLTHTGFLDAKNEKTRLKPGLQTQKYGLIELPLVQICGHQIRSFEVFVSHFEQSWGIDALIGLDFFRRFLVTIDYKNGFLVTSPYD
ncbi:MAG: hypothetical protein KJ638_05420 [Chloroflexi bacterium]|nr:hypothetical protein [Chloroflexota bacterium]